MQSFKPQEEAGTVQNLETSVDSPPSQNGFGTILGLWEMFVPESHNPIHPGFWDNSPE